MATTRTLPSPEPFSRIVESRSTSSWKAAIPAAVIVIAAIIAAAYFAAKASEQSQLLAGARNELTQSTTALSQLQARTATLEAQVNRLQAPGRTTVILKAAAAPKASRKGAEAPAAAWGAATWGEQPDGKTWIRMDAYGLAQAGQGKTYGLWFEGANGDAVAVAKLDPAPDGSAFAEGKDLPAVDQGKRLFVSLDDENAKTPGSQLMQADLPKLKPSVSSPGATQGSAAPAEGNAPAKQQ